MSLSDWEYLWRRPKPPVGANADVASLLETYESKHRKTANALFARDLVEASAGVFVTIAMLWMVWHMKKAVWLMAIAIALVVGVTAFFLRERLRARKHRPGPGASRLAKLESEIDAPGPGRFFRAR